MAGVINGTIYNLVDALLNPTVVLVVFTGYLTDSNFLLGLVGVVRSAAWLLPQLWMSSYIQRLEYVMPIYRYTALLRSLILLALVAAVLVVQDAGWLLLIFFFCITSEQLAAGLAGLPFMEVVAKVIPAARRGVFFSWRMTTGGVLAVGGGLLIRALLDSGSALAFPVNFAVIFGLANAIGILSMLAWIGFVEEPPSQPEALRNGFVKQVRRALEVWRADANYRSYLAARVSFMLVMGAATPFVTVYAQEGFAVSVETLAVCLAVNTVFGLLGTAAAGWVSVRMGNQRLIRLGAALGMLALVQVVLAAPLGLSGAAADLYFGVVFALVGLRNGALNIGLATLNINVAPVDRRPLYIGFANTVSGVFMLLGAGSGVLVDWVGFEMFFALALLPMLYGLWRVRALEDPTVARL